MKVRSQTKYQIEITQEEVLEILKSHFEQQGLLDDVSLILKHTIPETITVEAVNKISETDRIESKPSNATTKVNPVESNQYSSDIEKNVSSTINSQTEEDSTQDMVVPGYALKELSAQNTQFQLHQFNSSNGCNEKRITEDLFRDG